MVVGDGVVGLCVVVGPGVVDLVCLSNKHHVFDSAKCICLCVSVFVNVQVSVCF